MHVNNFSSTIYECTRFQFEEVLKYITLNIFSIIHGKKRLWENSKQSHYCTLNFRKTVGKQYINHAVHDIPHRNTGSDLNEQARELSMVQSCLFNIVNG